MKNVKDMAFQGDVMFIKVAKLPEGVTETNDLVCAHSETGHHHVAKGGNVSRFTSSNPMISYLVAQGPVEIEHHRSFDTHETLSLLSDGPGETVWQVKRQREHDPAGWRLASD